MTRSTVDLTPFSVLIAIVSHDIISPTLNCLPKHLEDTRWRYPHESNNQPFHVAHRTRLPMHAWCNRNPLYGPAIRSYADTLTAATAAFPDSHPYPVFQRLIQPFDPTISDVLLVGIGHVPHVLHRFKKMFPEHPGRLILENIDPGRDYPRG